MKVRLVILRKRHRDRKTNKRQVNHNLLGGGSVMMKNDDDDDDDDDEDGDNEIIPDADQAYDTDFCAVVHCTIFLRNYNFNFCAHA